MFNPVLNHPPHEFVLLQVGTILQVSEFLSDGDNLSDFELCAKSALTLIFLRKDLWEEIPDKRAAADKKNALQGKTSDIATLGYRKSQVALKTIERGRLLARGECSSPSPATAGTEFSTMTRILSAPDVVVAAAATVKHRSRESKKISAIMGSSVGILSRHSIGLEEVSDKSSSSERSRRRRVLITGHPPTILMPPPVTVRNRFAQQDQPPKIIPNGSYLDSNLRAAFLKNFLDTAWQQATMPKASTVYDTICTVFALPM
jgi:hypothetical protein